MLEGELLFETLPDGGCQRDGSRILVRLTMASDGTAQGTIEEVHTGAEAVRWRTVLGRTPPEERQGTLEEDYIADVLEGELVTDLKIRDEEALDRDLTVVYHVRDLQLGESPSPGVLRVVLPYQSEITSGYALLPVRQTPLVIRSSVNETVRFEIVLPEGATAQLPSTAHAINPIGEFSLTGLVEQEGLRSDWPRAGGHPPRRVRPARDLRCLRGVLSRRRPHRAAGDHGDAEMSGSSYTFSPNGRRIY